MFVTQTAQPLQKAGYGRHYAHVGRHRLYDNRRDLALISAQRLLNAFQIVIAAHQRMAHDVRRNAGAGGSAEGQRTGTGLHQQAVAVAMVAAFKLDDFAAPGKTSCRAQSAHGCLCSRIHHAHHVHAGISRCHQLGHLHLGLGGQAVAHAVRQRRLCRLYHIGVRVTQNHRPPGADIVQPVVPVCIYHMAALCAFDKHGAAPHRAKGPHGTVDAAGQYAAGVLKHLFGTCRLLHSWYSFHARA